jgi:hypothetical protein
MRQKQIFGQTASIWITDSVINTIAAGYITASGRSSNDANYYVRFSLKCLLSRTITPDQFYLHLFHPSLS